MRLLLGDVAAGAEPTEVYEVARRPVGDRPWVYANMVAGLDGSAAVHGRVGALSTPSDRTLLVLLRSLADVVLVGAGTVRAEGYGPVRLRDDLRAARVARGQGPLPPIAVVSRSLLFDWDTKLFGPGAEVRPIVITATGAGEEAIARAAEHADVIVAGDEAVDLRRALVELAARGASAVLTEGGPSLLGELIDIDLVDELCLTITAAVGGDPLPIVESSAGRELVRFSLASVVEDEGDLFLRYLVAR
jgi:riboflavin biosynthesis pyrimidine reductase